MKNISSENVKKLREFTGSGIMDCKKALVNCEGNIDKAIEELKKRGVVIAEKKGIREAKEGLIDIVINSNKNKCVIIEVNCETDFVAFKQEFKNYVRDLAIKILDNNIKSVEEFNLLCYEELENKRIDLISKFGENILIKKIKLFHNNCGSIGYYVHNVNNIGKCGSIVLLNGYNDDLAHDIAMQIVALNPEYIIENDIPKSRLEYEKSILLARSKDNLNNKSDIVINEIIKGQMSKIINNITLYGQFFIKDNKKLVKDILLFNNLSIIDMIRYEIGIK
ncbi:MAG TPA: translation elongation factor Ts [Candidatus Azosocius sp. HAIN]